ncbi:hypothetical protein CCACVL1_00008 [Corchorus capsularis]|uniref:Uncharacterized protein n=1 Tax=Corchorus capsularis TaxID=210143 RepID=A0A1R3KZF5_COCAP|nr:hypothetical protein CCACVL1_00008 [Corchorus capsularis]
MSRWHSTEPHPKPPFKMGSTTDLPPVAPPSLSLMHIISHCHISIHLQ